LLKAAALPKPAKGAEEAAMWRGSRSVFFHFLIPYLSLLAIAAAIGLSVLNVTAGVVKNGALEAATTALEHTGSLVDKYLSEMEITVRRMALSAEVKRISSMRAPFSVRDHYYVYEAQRSLADYGLQNDFVSMYYVYLRYSGSVILPDTSYKSSELFFQNYFGGGAGPYGQWAGDLSNPGLHKSYLGQTRMMVAGRMENVIPYVHLIPLNHYDDIKGAVVALVDAAEVNGLLGRLTADEGGSYWVVGADGEIVTSEPAGQGAAPMWEKSRAAQAGGGRSSWNYEENIDGRAMLMTCARSPYTGWIFVTALPYSQVMGEVIRLEKLIVLIGAAIILFGLAMSLFFSYRNSRPLTKLIDRMVEKSGAGFGRGERGYSLIESALDKAYLNSEHMERQLRQQAPLLKAGLFDRLCRGGFGSEDEILEAYADIGLAAPDGVYVCLVMRLPRQPEPEGAGGGASAGMPDAAHGAASERHFEEFTDYERKRTFVRELMRENEGVYELLFDSGDNNRATLLLGFPAHMDGSLGAYVAGAVEQAIARLAAVFGAGFLCAGGRVCLRLLDIYKSYNDAVATIEYMDGAISEDSLVWYDDIPKRRGGLYYPIEAESRLMMLVKAGKKDEIGAAIREIMQENNQEASRSKQTARLLLQEMAGTLIKLRGQTDLPDAGETPAFEGMEDLGAQTQGDVAAAFEALAASMASRKKSHNRELEQGVIAYIDENFTNSSLTLVMVADRFSISETYLSFFFHEQTGMTFSRYLEKLRIDRASGLLQKGGLTIYQIAEAVGYNSAQSFRRAFKRVTNVNPSDIK
ncbi:MAG: AraC family transcriptional regulator, partial [Clostridiales bacterium]|nr:AraC family transcriptional regulator [Clostridiales bacterium]